MCKICKKKRPPKESVNKILREVESAIKNGQDPNHFEAFLNKLLNNEMEDRNNTVEKNWQDEYDRNKK